MGMKALNGSNRLCDNCTFSKVCIAKINVPHGDISSKVVVILWHPLHIKLTTKKLDIPTSDGIMAGKVFSRATIGVSSSEYSHRHWEQLCTISSFRPWYFSKFSYLFLLMLLSHTGLPPPSSLFSVPSPLTQCLLGWPVLVYLSGSAGPTGP